MVALGATNIDRHLLIWIRDVADYLPAIAEQSNKIIGPRGGNWD
jgi:hypothetical protein